MKISKLKEAHHCCRHYSHGWLAWENPYPNCPDKTWLDTRRAKRAPPARKKGEVVKVPNRPRKHSRVRPDPYHALEEYRGFSLRYCSDPVWAGTVRVYVERHPSPDYAGRETLITKIHMWPASNGVPPYICFKEEFAPRTYEGARRLAEQWADCTLIYIATGRTISEQLGGS